MTTAPAPRNVGRFDGIDYFVRSMLTDNGTNVVIMGGNENFPSDVTNDLIKVSISTFNQVWRRQYIAGGIDFNCAFGLTSSIDGGVVVGGNNELNGEDYFMLKMGNDCGTNTGTLTLNGGIAITGTVNWTSTNKTVRGEVRINPGATLNINGTSVISFADTRAYNDYDFLIGADTHFAPYTSAAPWNSQPTKIIIMPGGTLNVGGTARLTSLNSACPGYSNMWEGIEIWGEPGFAQAAVGAASDTHQGRMITTTGITAERMFAGISMEVNFYDAGGRPAHGGIFPNGTYGGGYLVMTNGTLLNNRYGVYMGQYSWTSNNNEVVNNTSFTGTTFMQNAHLPDITFMDAQGVRLGTDRFFEANSCSKVKFTNTRFKGFPTLLKQYRGYGIKSNDTEILCTTSSTTVPAFNFEDLYRGYFGVQAIRSLQMRDNRFNNNDLAVEVHGGQGAQISGNTINVPLGSSNPDFFPSGVRLDGHTYAQVVNNIIAGMGTGASADLNRGVVVHDCGTNVNLVGYNTFSKLKIGEQSQGTNGASGNSTVGLAMQCNTHSANNYFDIAINKVNGIGVMPQQGQGCFPLTQSGNTFADQTGCGSPVAENIISSVNFTYFGVLGASGDPVCRSSTVNYPVCSSAGPNCPGSNLICTTPACNQQNISAMNAESDVEKKEILRNRIVAYYIAVDSPTVAITSLTAWNNSFSKRRLVPMYLRTKQWANAQTALNAIGSGNAEDAAYTTVYQTLIDIGNSGTSILGYTVAQKSALDIVAKGSTSMKYTAQALLNIATGAPITLTWVEPDESGSGTSTVKSMEQPSAFGDLVAMPNPFTGSTTIVCPLPTGTQDITLTITDLQGRMVEQRNVSGASGQLMQEVNSDGKPDGVYLCSVTADGVVIGITRIVVQH
jgi:hypothetical protein